ncbi:MAG TPA: DUF2795 domain-containing protein [Ktedonobacteraceae bacterium]|jgi:hypothetical protein|nr:DUF2795 domain-containing protein [Ktedonobacteraceae bacterium]
MNIDPGQINQLVNNLPFPISKNDVIQRAKQYGANDQMVNGLQQMLPNQTFNSPQDLMNCCSGMMGGMQGKMGGMMGGKQDQGDQGQQGKMGGF